MFQDSINKSDTYIGKHMPEEYKRHVPHRKLFPNLYKHVSIGSKVQKWWKCSCWLLDSQKSFEWPLKDEIWSTVSSLCGDDGISKLMIDTLAHFNDKSEKDAALDIIAMST